MLLLLTAVSPAAFAAEVTDMPPGLRADVEIDYQGHSEFGFLEEGDEVYGRRKVMRHDINYSVEFSPVDGLALVIALPHTPFLRYSFRDATSMIYEPVSAGGTYTFGEPIPDAQAPAFFGTGLQGVWLGGAFAPFSERYERNHQVTWRIDLAYRTANKRSIWTAQETGDKRGAAPGGSAFKVGAAFSSEKRNVEPYIDFELVRENKVQSVDIYDEDKVQHAAGLTLQPPSTIDLRGGFEVVAYEDTEEGVRIAMDMFMGFGYRSFADVPSGIFLPSVLEASRDIAVSSGDYLTAIAGLGYDWHISKYVGIRTGANFRYITPHRLEHVYPVRTSADTFGIDWAFSTEGRFR